MEIEMGIILCRLAWRICSGNQFYFHYHLQPYARNIHGGKFELEKHCRNRVIFYCVIFDGRENATGLLDIEAFLLLLLLLLRGSGISSLEFTAVHINFNKEYVTTALRL